jgi:hypothetical protein
MAQGSSGMRVGASAMGLGSIGMGLGSSGLGMDMDFASSSTAGQKLAAVFDPGHLKDVLDFFTKLELEVGTDTDTFCSPRHRCTSEASFMSRIASL